MTQSYLQCENPKSNQKILSKRIANKIVIKPPQKTFAPWRLRALA
jgi:hypothetical protein